MKLLSAGLLLFAYVGVAEVILHFLVFWIEDKICEKLGLEDRDEYLD